MTEAERINKANEVIDRYAATLKERMASVIDLHKRNNPGWEFSYLEFKLDEKEDLYTLKPIYQKSKE